ncbi:MAG: deoxycytidylate deaminase [Bacillota bacterium]
MSSTTLSNLTLPADPAAWIEDLEQPDWDSYFMSMVFMAAMRSPDQETKQGCIVVDWPTKDIIGTGYNGHPRKSTAGLPTRRPDKYPCMVHADLNAALRCHGKISTHAVVYLPMPPCEVCLGAIANMPLVAVKRIVYLEYRQFPNTEMLLRHLPHITCEQYQGPHPAEWLEKAAIYARIRSQHGPALSVGSTRTYSK